MDRAEENISEVTMAIHQKSSISAWDVQNRKIKDPKAALQL